MLTLTPVASPEAEELEQQKQTLLSLEKELTEKELELSTVHSEMHFFEKRYQSVVGIKYAELDVLKAQIFNFASQIYPKSDEFRAHAENAQEQARQSEFSAHDSEESQIGMEEPAKDFKPSEDLKKLFRRVARKIHPDLASNASERERRHELMAKLNKAYDCQDDDSIRAILVEWEAGEPAENLSLGQQLMRTLKQVAQVRKRLNSIEWELDKLFNSPMFILREKAAQGDKVGKDVLHELMTNVEEKILRIKARVRDLTEDL
jgi:hypothetical protein